MGKSETETQEPRLEYKIIVNELNLSCREKKKKKETGNKKKRIIKY